MQFNLSTQRVSGEKNPYSRKIEVCSPIPRVNYEGYKAKLWKHGRHCCGKGILSVMQGIFVLRKFLCNKVKNSAASIGVIIEM